MEETYFMDKYTAQAPTTEEAIQKALKELNVTREEAKIDVIVEGKKGFLGLGQKDAVVTVRRKKSQPILDEFILSNDFELDINTSDEGEKEEIDQKNLESEEKPPSNKEKIAESSVKETQTEIERTGQIVATPQEKDDEAIQTALQYIESVADQMGASPVQVYVKQDKQQVTFTIDTEKAGIVIGRHGKVLNALQSLVQAIIHKEADSKLFVIVDTEDYRIRRENTLQKLAEKTASRVMKTKRSVTLEPMPAHERKIIHHFLGRNAQIQTHSEGKEPHRYLVVSLSED